MSSLRRFIVLLLLVVASPATADEPLPARALLRLGTSRWKAARHVSQVFFTPDDAHLYSHGSVIQKWEVKTGRLLETWPKGSGEMIALSPDGKWMLTGGVQAKLQVVDVRTQKAIRDFPTEPCSQAAFAPDGKSAVCLLDYGKGVALCDFATGETLRRYEGVTKRLHRVLFSPDGTYIAASEEGDFGWNASATILIWETASAKLLRRIACKHQGSMYDVAFTPDNRRLIVGSYQRVRIYDLATGQSEYVLGHDARGHVAIDPRGRWLVTGFAGILWDLQNDCRLGRLTPAPDLIGALAISRDGRTLVTASASIFHHTLEVWDTATGQSKFPAVRHRAAVDEVAFSPDGQTLATRSVEGDSIHLWDAGTGKPRRTLTWGQGPHFTFGTFGFLDQGKVLLAGGKRWQTSSGEPLPDWVDVLDRKERQTSPVGDQRHVQRFCISPNARFAADLDVNQHVRIWNLDEGQVLARISMPHAATVELPTTRYTFTSDSKTLIVTHTTSLDRAESHPISLFDVETKKPSASHALNPNDEVDHLELMPGGKRLVLSGKNGVAIRDLASGELLHRWTKNPNKGLRSSAIALSPDGRVLAFESEQTELTLCEPMTGKTITAWPTTSGPVRAIAFSPDGRRLLTGSQDSSSLLWGLSPAPDSAHVLKTMTDDTLWATLAHDPASAYSVVWALASAPERALPLLAKRLSPEPEPDSMQIDRWINDLANASFVRRDEATRQLCKQGPVLVPSLQAILKKPHSLETKRRLEEVLRSIESASLTPERLREERSLQIVEMIGTPEARRLLAALAKGAGGSPRTRGAQAALDRLAAR